MQVAQKWQNSPKVVKGVYKTLGRQLREELIEIMNGATLAEHSAPSNGSFLSMGSGELVAVVMDSQRRESTFRIAGILDVSFISKS